MDPYNSSYDTEDRDEEPFRCSPTYDEDDIVCLGSDSEQTAEEVAQKHQRYESEARRIVEGRLPILQSASLKGPFETGWINPWRYRPAKTKVKDQDWWQPGSEDMLFTRARVMERAAAHGLGYLQPADALSWCKATARAEAEIINETNIHSGQILRSVERDEPDNPEDLDDFESEDSDKVQDTNKADRSHTGGSLERPELSMLNHYSETSVTEKLERNTNDTKRPADRQWLKGSFVSKRARWEEPAVATPTPFSDVLERDRRRRQLSTRLSDRERAKTRKPSRLLKSFNSFKEAPQNALASVRGPITPQDIEQPRYGEISTFSRHEMTSPLGQEDFGHQNDDFDELQDNSQDYSFQMAPQSGVKSQKIEISFNDRSLADLEPDDLNVITPRTKSRKRTSRHNAKSSDIHVLDTDAGNWYDLPKLFPGKIVSLDGSEGDDQGQEDSFVTEVAPSSRNLEKFKFKKRRPKLSKATQQQPVIEPNDDRHRFDSGAESQHSDGQCSASMQFTEQGQEMVAVPEHRPISSYKVPPMLGRPSISSQTTPPKSDEDEAGGSWDLIGDVTGTSSFRRVLEALQTTSPPKSRTSTSASPYTTPKKGSLRLHVAPDSSHLLRESRPHGSVEAGPGRINVPPCSNDMSTQSFNTTPPGSMLSPVRPPPSLIRGLLSHKSKVKPSMGRGRISEMDNIQLALSQACPSSSREDSPHNSPERDLKQNSIGNDGSSKRKSSERFLVGDRETTTSPVTPHRSYEVRVPGLPTMEFTEFANESFLFLGEYITDPVPAGAPAIFEGDGEPTTPPTIHEHQIPKTFDDVSPEDDSSSLRHRTELEDSQVSNAVINSTTVAPVVSGNALDIDHLNPNHDPKLDQCDHARDSISIEAALHPVELQNPADVQTRDEDRLEQELSRKDLEDQAELGKEGSPKQGDKVAELDEGSSQKQQKEQPGNDATSPLIDTLKDQSQTSIDAESPDVQPEANNEDIITQTTPFPNTSEQADDEAHSRMNNKVAEPDNDQSTDPAAGSEASWQGCGPQSPWATEKIESLPTVFLSKEMDFSPRPEREEVIFTTESVQQEQDSPHEEMSWITMERPSTPEGSIIKPFKDFSTPTPSPARHTGDSERSSMDTQSRVDAALRNPWTRRSKSQSSGKTCKRVSFGIVPLNDEVNSPQENTHDLDTPHSPPPAQAEDTDQDEDIFNDGTTVTTTFGKHFIAATRRRQFKRILPAKRSSQLDSSPTLLEAQAEAFIAADHDIPVHQRSTSARKSPSRHLKILSDPNTNIWNESEEDDTMLGKSFSPSPAEKTPVTKNTFAGFDMVAALGEAGDFLEDWSVDSVLKNTRENESTQCVESNGMKRRRLFGLG
ncbi:hypothetical protein VTL71DRAFT_14358 [Oculimacula yallundae]|uniref:Protamine P1 n=1 Tax=Oculimacula yallundae TaxID=86028 RepID=A0ABR4CKJ8_9HELO